MKAFIDDKLRIKHNGTTWRPMRNPLVPMTPEAQALADEHWTPEVLDAVDVKIENHVPDVPPTKEEVVDMFLDGTPFEQAKLKAIVKLLGVSSATMRQAIIDEY